MTVNKHGKDYKMYKKVMKNNHSSLSAKLFFYRLTFGISTNPHSKLSVREWYKSEYRYCYGCNRPVISAYHHHY